LLSFFFVDISYLENVNTTLSRKLEKQLPIDAVRHPTRAVIACKLLRELTNLQFAKYFLICYTSIYVLFIINFELHAAVTVSSTELWNVTPCIMAENCEFWGQSVSVITVHMKFLLWRYTQSVCHIILWRWCNMRDTLMCIWTSSIVTDYTNMTFWKQTAFLFRWTTVLRIS
jgi:hypothetical protein